MQHLLQQYCEPAPDVQIIQAGLGHEPCCQARRLRQAEVQACRLLTAVALQICDTTAELGMDLVPSNTWPELLPFLFQCTQHTEPRMVEAALLIFAQLSG